MKCYLVHGSEDGTLGIYSSKKKAMARALEYVAAIGDEEASVEAGNWNTYVAGNGVEARIEKWEME